VPAFNVTEGNDPFLSVHLGQGESINAASRAMVTMTMALTLTGRLQGGIIRSLIRKKTQGDTAFLQVIQASSYPGKVLLAPSLPGDIQIIELREYEELFINDGCYLASSSTVELTSKLQGPGKAFFGGTGGFVIMRALGPGTVAVSGYGSITPINMRSEESIVDHRHVVSWDSGIKYEVATLSSSQGILTGLFRGMTSGEGIVNRFYGTGKMNICSRNRDDLLAWVFNSMKKANKSTSGQL
jgi:uncharacterized protein (TIGR00266 family)